ncbi:conserved hypothetical protein [Chloroherpeton thalassium ATCC 35110]|uniref:Phosphoesterase PA-phosphatase related n=1 Tax=Chloroherpeton thalassium (strain ATCC 35110 / GB-78) TaxID=517418 RepID=B3QXA6_CHLT3|nr:hypothetical protein [Chloroherpeton thalassium]ACF13380.1 conserved hypothetical protein [Chloroherpeton thalassium ATCC 35110]
MSNKKKFIAELISSILHPIVVPVVAYWILLEQAFPENSHRYYYLFTLFIFFTVIPSIMVISLKKKGKITDYDISNRSQRAVPLAIAVVAYLIGYLILEHLNAPRIISGLLIFYAMNTLILMLITFRWKISVHLSSFTAPLAVLFVQFGPVVLWALLLTPFLIWSRVFLKAHTLMQAIAGSIMGFLLLFFEISIWLNL